MVHHDENISSWHDVPASGVCTRYQMYHLQARLRVLLNDIRKRNVYSSCRVKLKGRIYIVHFFHEHYHVSSMLSWSFCFCFCPKHSIHLGKLFSMVQTFQIIIPIILTLLWFVSLWHTFWEISPDLKAPTWHKHVYFWSDWLLTGRDGCSVYACILFKNQSCPHFETHNW